MREIPSELADQQIGASGTRVSVIVPVLDDFERLRICLRALERQTWPKAQLEVLVVDNGSRGDIGPVLEPFDFVRLLREAAPGSYSARNRALPEARGEVLAFTDADCVPDAEWIAQGVAALQQAGGKAVVGGDVEVFPRDGDHPTWAEDFELALGFSQQSYIEEKHYCATANMFTSPEIFAQVGPFNDALKSGGDQEWGQRAFAAGVPLVYAKSAIVRHPARHTFAQLFKKRARLVGGHLGIAREQHPEWLAFSKVMVKACLPPVERVLRARRTKSSGTKGWRRDARVLAVAVSLQAYSVVELMRLRMGGEPVR